jgi:hypothetical protein
VDIHRRWLVVLDGPALAGLFFFHFKPDGNIHLDELRIAWPYRNNNAVFNQLLSRFTNDPSVKNAPAVFAGKNIKRESAEEMLASVGFEEHNAGGNDPLGSPGEAAGALTVRYIR